MARRIPLSDEIRRTVCQSKLTRYRISQETAIDQGTLSRFVHGKAGLSMDALDRLATLLDLHVIVRAKSRGR